MRADRVSRRLRVAAVAIGFVLASWTAAGAQAIRQNEPGKFDYYVLALSWSPSWCAVSQERNPERAPDQQHFLNRERTKTMFREILKRGNGGKNWEFTNSPLFMDFLAGNQTYECTPWSMPLLTVFGWQKPCYLLGEGYVKTFKELMEGTEWEKYGVGKYEKCANCMVHCGFEGTAATDAIRHPLKMLPIALRGVKTDGPFAPEIDLSKQRPAEFVFSAHVQKKMSEIRAGKSDTTEVAAAE